MNKHESLGIYDYDRNKICDLYDSQIDLIGQAYSITVTREWNGTHKLEFEIPYVVEDIPELSDTNYSAVYGLARFGYSRYGQTVIDMGNRNYRWAVLKNEYLIKYTCGNRIIWFVANKPQKHKTEKKIYGKVSCDGFETLLKTRNIYMVFDDENGIGTISYLLTQILKGTGWTYDNNGSDIIYERDNVTEKIRSLQSDGKKGAFDLITTVCTLFQARPIFNTDTLVLTIKSINNREQILEGEVGRNLNALSVKHDSSNIVTRLYVEGEYGDYGYVGIDDVIVDGEKYGLPFLVNFDYYRKIGVFKQRHETALQTYLTNIKAKKQEIRNNGALLIAKEDDLNNLIGQCQLAVYYKDYSLVTPKYKYGGISDEHAALSIGDSVVILKNNGTHTYEDWTGNSGTQLNGAYGVAKFYKPASGKIGSAEVQIESKEKSIALLQRKIDSTTKADKIAEYQAEINRLNAEILVIYNGDVSSGVVGLYSMMSSVMNSSGHLYQLSQYEAINTTLNNEQDEIEATFIAAMGYMLHDGYWSNDNYIVGQENYLYADAVDMSAEMGKPETTYTFSYLRIAEDYDVPAEEIEINALFKIYDSELEINDEMFIKKVVYGVDNKSLGSIEVSNQDITLTGNDLGSLLSRMSQLADLIDQKNQMYERASAISRNGTFFTDRLNGKIDVLRTQFLSTVSNWYTDEQGNIVFEAADGSSAMMLCGAGFMIASSKNDDGSWNYRTFGDGRGFTADEIIAGFISADRIEAGTISVNHLGPNVGSELPIGNNSSITTLNSQFAPEFVTTRNYSIGDYVMHDGQLYKFTSSHSAGAWNANHVTAIQTSSMVSDYVSRNAYEVVTGIDIDSAGIQITGAKYVKIKSGATFDVEATNFKIDSTNKKVETGEWTLEPRGLTADLYYSSTNYMLAFGRTGITYPIDKPFIGVLPSISGYIGSKYSGSFQFVMIQSGASENAGLTIDVMTGLNPPRVVVGTSLISGGSSLALLGILGSSTKKWRVYGENVYYDSLIQNSSRDIKHDIQDMPSVGDKLDGLKPVTFVYDDDEEEKIRTGLIYEDTMEVMPEICTRDESAKAISYVELIPALLKEIQDLRSRVAELERG